MQEQIEMLEGIDVPEIFSSHLGGLEDAGDGLIRVIRCVRRRGMLIPVINIIMPAHGILEDGPRFREMAHRIMRGALASH